MDSLSSSAAAQLRVAAARAAAQAEATGSSSSALAASSAAAAAEAACSDKEDDEDPWNEGWKDHDSDGTLSDSDDIAAASKQRKHKPESAAASAARDAHLTPSQRAAAQANREKTAARMAKLRAEKKALRKITNPRAKNDAGGGGSGSRPGVKRRKYGNKTPERLAELEAERERRRKLDEEAGIVTPKRKKSQSKSSDGAAIARLTKELDDSKKAMNDLKAEIALIKANQSQTLTVQSGIMARLQTMDELTSSVASTANSAITRLNGIDAFLNLRKETMPTESSAAAVSAADKEIPEGALPHLYMDHPMAASAADSFLVSSQTRSQL